MNLQNSNELDGYFQNKKKKALVTIAILVVFGLWWVGSELYADFKSKAIGREMKREKMERITKIINKPDENSYLRFGTKKEIIILQAASSSKDSVTFLVGKPIKTTVHIYEKVKKLDFYNSTSIPEKRIKIAKNDLRKVLAMEDKIEKSADRFMMIETLNQKEPVTLVNGIFFNGVELKSSGYKYARKEIPANLSLNNEGLPITVDTIKSVKGEILNPKTFPFLMDTNELLPISIKPPTDGNNQTWTFDIYVTTELGIKHKYRIERKNKETLIYEIT